MKKCREVAKERLALLHFKSNFGKPKIAIDGFVILKILLPRK